jgi:membrane associated rhomboid family serine protease
MFGRLSVNTLLIILNVAVFLLQTQVGYKMEAFALWPPGDSPYGEGWLFRPWQLLTHGFMHGDATHLFFNMFALFMFGSRIESLFGSKRYLIYYLTCVIGAAALHMIVTATIDQQQFYSMVGASGAVFGLLLAFGMAYPKEKMMLIFLPIPIPAWLFVTLYGLAELYLGITGTLPGIAHFAHLGGMVTGFVMIRYWQQQARRLRR